MESRHPPGDQQTSKKTPPSQSYTTILVKQSSQTHLEQVDDPGGFPAASSNRLQDKAAGHHLPPDSVHTGTRQGLLEDGLQGQHAHASLRKNIQTVSRALGGVSSPAAAAAGVSSPVWIGC